MPFAAYSEFAGEASTLAGLSPEDLAPADHGHSWDDLTGVPADLADGDDGQSYRAGAGLTLNAATNTFSVNRPDVEDWARGVCIDNEGELTAILDDLYLSSSGTGCDEDDILTWNGRAWECAPIPAVSDADTLDGLDSTDFARDDHTHPGGGGGAAPWVFGCTPPRWETRCEGACVGCSTTVEVDGPAILTVSAVGTVVESHTTCCLWIEIDGDAPEDPCRSDDLFISQVGPFTSSTRYPFSISRYVQVEEGAHLIEFRIFSTSATGYCYLTRWRLHGVATPLY